MKYPVFENILSISAENQLFRIMSKPDQNILLFQGTKNEFLKEKNQAFKDMNLLPVLIQEPDVVTLQGMDNKEETFIRLNINLDYQVMFGSKKIQKAGEN
jgi:hypothetical protein